MVSKNYEENIEKSLDEFTEKRCLIGDEIIKIRDSAKRLLDEMFNNLMEKLSAESNKTDATIDERIREMKKYINNIKEMETYLHKAKSVFDASDSGGFVRTF